MAREIELKLEIDPAHAAALSASNLMPNGPRVERLVSVYFDTAKGKLRRHGMVLRVRQHDGTWIQTIKCSNGGSGLFDRGEWETEVNGFEPSFQAIANSPAGKLIGPRQFRHLVPVFRTDIERRSWELKDDGGSIELSYDVGQVEAGNEFEPIHELELELKDGSLDTLVSAARKIAGHVPARLGMQAKSERGYALAWGQDRAPIKATPVELNEQASVAHGFTAVVMACLKHFRLNEPLLVAHRNAEALHQLRVAVRRLRSALWLFRPAVRDAEYASFNERLRKLTRELGAARNIDVILASIPLNDPARSELEDNRKRLYAKIQRKLGSRSFRLFLFDLLAWAHVGEWRLGPNAARPLMPFALKRIDRLWRRITQRGDAIRELEPVERHRLRIDSKKIRYSLEFLRDLITVHGKDRERFIACAEGVQEGLGYLNDLAIRHEMAGSAGWLLVVPDNEADRHLKAARRSYRRMRKIGPFWRGAKT